MDTIRVKKEIGDYGLSYTLFIIKFKENYKKFINLRLFSKSIVKSGYNKSKKGNRRLWSILYIIYHQVQRKL